MFKNLKFQFVISHILPILVIMPLIALAFYYAMGTNRILVDMQKTIQEQAKIITEYAKNNQNIWQSSSAAQKFIQEIRPNLVTGIVIFDVNNHVLAQSDNTPDDNETLTPSINSDFNSYTPILEVSKYNPFKNTGSNIQMMVPVIDDQNTMLGLIRVNLPIDYFERQMTNTKRQLTFILIGGLALSVFLGLWRADHLEKHLSKTTNAIYDLSKGIRNKPLPVTGPDEISKLSIAFNSLAGKLEESEQFRSNLISRLTHELGRPLGGLSSAVDAIQRGAWKDQSLTMELTAEMKNEIKLLENVIGDISLLREESEKIKYYHFELTNIKPVLENLVPYYIEFSKNKKITITSQLSDNLPLLNIDVSRFNQAIGNLMSNAIKYTQNGGHITLSAEKVNNEVQISVTDDGSGISAEDLPHLFESFYRGQTGKRIVQGMGLGLSIAQEVIHEHQGTITVQSEIGKGSTFTIHLPIPVENVQDEG